MSLIETELSKGECSLSPKSLGNWLAGYKSKLTGQMSPVCSTLLNWQHLSGGLSCPDCLGTRAHYYYAEYPI